MQIVTKRGHFYVVDDKGNILLKTNDEQAARKLAGLDTPAEETLDGSTEKKEDSKKEASTDKQTIVFGSKKPSKKKV
jgi:hypothetical protein